MFQEGEIFNLLLGVISLVIVFYEIRRRKIPGFQMFLWGFFFICFARFFTVVEGLFWGDIFNILEHFSYTFASVAFAAGCIVLSCNNIKDVKG
jgi:uncharacterized membrane protein